MIRNAISRVISRHALVYYMSWLLPLIALTGFLEKFYQGNHPTAAAFFSLCCGILFLLDMTVVLLYLIYYNHNETFVLYIQLMFIFGVFFYLIYIILSFSD